MKKITFLFLVLFVFMQNSFAWWTNLYNTGTPWSSYYLGDYQSNIFEFGVNQETTPMTVSYGIGKSTNGTDWIWRAAEWSRMDGVTNRVWKSKINEQQFTSIGNWYYSGRFVWTENGYTEYASSAWAENRTSLTASSYFTVSNIVDPSSPTAISAGYSDISLSWTKNAVGNDVMVVRYAHNATPTAPTNGTSYTSGNTIGSGTVIYYGSETNTTSSGLNSSTAYDYYFYSVNNNYYSPGVMKTTNTDTKETDYFRSKGTGNWETPSSWETSSDGTNWITSTLAPSSSSTSVVVENGHKISIGYSSTASSVTIKPTGQLTINAGYTLGVTGNLNIQSDVTGTGTYVDENSGTGLPAITGTVNQYLITDRNWYLSSPVSAAAVPAADNVWYYDETVVNADPLASWKNPTGNLAVGKGYIVNPTGSAVTVQFNGTLNTGDKSIGLTRTTAKSSQIGFNLVGNPYPSYMNAATLLSANTGKVENNIWYRTHTGSVYQFQTYNSISDLSVPKASNGSYIPPMQAFWVRALSNGVNLNFTNAMRKHNDSTVAIPLKVRAESDRQLIRLQVSNGTVNDELVIYSNANASNGFDAYDSPKMLNGSASLVPDLYTTAGSEKLVINGMNSLPLDVVIPVSFVANNAVSTQFTISANEISNIPSGITLKIVDNGIETSLSNGGTYTFTADTGTDKTLGLILRSPGTVTEIVTGNLSNISVYANLNREIIVKQITSNEISIAIFNSVGQQIVSRKTNNLSEKFNLISAGVYYVKIGEITRKIVVN